MFCVQLIRSILLEDIATSAICGKSVKACYDAAIEHVTRITGMAANEIAEFLPEEFTFKGAVVVHGQYHEYTAKKSRFELYPIIC